MRGVRRALGLIVALVALGGAALLARSIGARRTTNARAEAARVAESAASLAAGVLRQQVETVEISAARAAGLQSLKNVLSPLRAEPLEGQLANTLKDFFALEQDWETFRKQFPIYGLSVDAERFGILVGTSTQDLPPGDLLKRARELGSTFGTLLGKDRVYAAAATEVTVPGLPEAVILLLARPMEESWLREAADKAGGAIMLSDTKRPLDRNGSTKEINLLSGLVGKEAATPRPGAQDGTWAAAAAQLGPGLWVWVYTSALASAREQGVAATTTQAIVWVAGAAIAALALLFGLWRRKPPSAPVVVTPAPVLVPALAGQPAARESGVSAYGSTIQAAGAVPPPRAGAGQAFGRYLLLDRLGEGGMSQVYTAVTFGAEGFRRKFVVKRLRPELAGNADVVAQFIDEANMASSLVHSNIVPVFDFGKVADEYFLATEYILGRDLGRLVTRSVEATGKPLPLPVVLHCAHETLKALDYAHTKRGEGGQALGIVHRDVSPSNVLISARGEVKLFDFGIVKAQGRVTQTQHGVVKGNVSFMSPEQARGVEVDARADLYSMGLVMYHCLTADLLFQGESTYSLLLAAASGPGPEERARVAALPAPAAAVVTRALEVDPAKRYQSAAEFEAALAPLARATTGDLAALMQRLFADDFNKEEERFSSAMPRQTPAQPLPGRQ